MPVLERKRNKTYPRIFQIKLLSLGLKKVAASFQAMHEKMQPLNYSETDFSLGKQPKLCTGRPSPWLKTHMAALAWVRIKV
jgi:hypothetical protein